MAPRSRPKSSDGPVPECSRWNSLVEQTRTSPPRCSAMVGGVVAGRDAGVGEQRGAAVLDLEAAGDDGVLGGDCAHGLLGVRCNCKRKGRKDAKVRKGMRKRDHALLPQEVGDELLAVVGEDGLGVELHAFNGQRAVAQAHDGAMAGRLAGDPGGDFETRPGRSSRSR